jgi:hypothetical protein
MQGWPISTFPSSPAIANTMATRPAPTFHHVSSRIMCCRSTRARSSLLDRLEHPVCQPSCVTSILFSTGKVNTPLLRCPMTSNDFFLLVRSTRSLSKNMPLIHIAASHFFKEVCRASSRGRACDRKCSAHRCLQVDFCSVRSLVSTKNLTNSY